MHIKVISIVYHWFIFLFSTKTPNGKFDYLDGYRGSLALWVLIHHSCYFLGILKNDYLFFDLLGYYIGVVGFFLLSSFLLTYRMLCQLYETKNGIIIITIDYFNRRFFRIYVPFLIFASLVKFISPKFGGQYNFSTSWYSIISLKSAGFTHLWTIAPEIKYYFFIPILCITTYKFRKIWFIWDLLLIISLYYIEHRKIFLPYSNFELSNGYLFLTRFSVFYLGSVLAILYFRLKKSFLYKYFENYYIKFILGLVSMLIYLYGLYYWAPFYNQKLNFDGYTFKSALYWSLLMFLMVIGSPNFFTDIFNLSFLKYTGRFSYGIYMFHPMCIFYVNVYAKKIRADFELLIYSVLFSFFIGFLFFYFVENLLMKLSDFIFNKIKNYLNGKSVKYGELPLDGN